MENIRELEFLRQLKVQYGSHYLRKYFGFTLREIAERIGLSKEQFSLILTGRYPLGNRADAFIRVFKEMQIEEKSRGFIMSDNEKNHRVFMEHIRNLLTK